LFGAWLALALILVFQHVFWRDEVRAFTLALAGGNVVDMARGLQGEGHPALWYLLLRGAHTVAPVRAALPATAFAVAAAAMALLAFKSPFRLPTVSLILFGAFGLIEYTVVARNYGISMLVLFALAHVYPRWRDRGVAVGLLLALLCNTNVPSALLAACFLLFWLVELIGEEGVGWRRKHRLFVLNAAVAAAGALLCFVTVYPPVHDAAAIHFAAGLGPKAVAAALAVPAFSFWDFVPSGVPPTYAAGGLLSVVVFGSLLGLLRAPGALLSAVAALAGLELFFQLIYPGYYRHECLFLVYLIALYWLVAKGRGGRWPEGWMAGPAAAWAVKAGRAMFALLLAWQVVSSASLVATAARGYPYSRARDLARVLEREHLGSAVLIADPDMFLEPLPYYTDNPLYLMREQRFGRVVRFIRRVRTDLDLDDYLRDARALHARTGRAVVIVLEHRLDDIRGRYRKHEVHVWNFSADPAQVQRFRAATRRLAAFGPAVTDETYDVYLLLPDPAAAGSRGPAASLSVAPPAARPETR
jgi:hypothetical protein